MLQFIDYEVSKKLGENEEFRVSQNQVELW